jgi:protein-disulfide isomerase
MNTSWKKIILAGFAVYGSVVLIAVMLLLFTARFGPSPASVVPENAFTSLIGQGSAQRGAPITLVPDWAPVYGPEDAEITIVEFADFQCPFCREAALPLRRVLAAYPDDVRLVFRQFPITTLHPMAKRLAESSLCANAQGKFWSFHDQVYFTGNNETLRAEDIDPIARAIGLDIDEYNRCLISGQFKDAVDQDFADGLAVGSRGTPTWVVNGQKVEGYLSESSWKQLVETILK